MRTRKQEGQVIRIGDRWYVRYWERRNIGGTIERKRVTHQLGPVTTRGKRPPADIMAEAERHMATINSGTIPADRIVTICDFVERVYLPWVKLHKRPSTVKGYRDIWEDHLKPLCGQVWLKDARTYHVQGWLNQIAAAKLSRNTLKHIKSTISGTFTLAKQQDYFQGERTQPAILPLILEPLSPRKPMPTAWRKYRQSSVCSPNLRRLRSRLPGSWDCGMARYRGRYGRTTGTGRFTCPVPSGMAA